MMVTITHASLPGLPPPVGPHELAWSYILDAVFADAHHAGVGHIQVVLPTKRLGECVEIRGLLSRQAPRTVSTAIANLSGGETPLGDAARVYTLGFGTMAPRALRRLGRSEPRDFELVSHLSLFTPTARLWGIPIRLGRLAGRPDLIDSYMAAMRRSFASERDPHAYYQLSIWGKA